MNIDTRSMGREIAETFLREAGDVRLNPGEAAIVQRASDELAYVGVAAVGATPAQLEILTVRRDVALSTLANLSVAQAIEAEALAKRVALEVVLRAVRGAVAVALAV